MSDHIDVQHARDNLRHMKEEERQHAQEFWERTQAAGRAIQRPPSNLRNRRRLRNRASRGREKKNLPVCVRRPWRLRLRLGPG